MHSFMPQPPYDIGANFDSVDGRTSRMVVHSIHLSNSLELTVTIVRTRHEENLKEKLIKM